MVALLILIAGVLSAALVASGSVEQRIADRDADVVHAAVESQRPAAEALALGQVAPGAPALRPIAEGARQRSGGAVRIVGEGGSLLLQTDSTTHTDTAAIAADALQRGRWRTKLVGSGDGAQRLTAVPFHSPGGVIAVIAMTPARQARAAAGAYFRRKALMRSPNRS